MAIRLPSLGPSSSGPTPQGVSPSAATAPSLALGAVARGLGKAADELDAHDQRIQQVQNSADLTEIKTKMKSAYAEYQAGLVDNHDPKSYLEGWQERLSGLQREVMQGKYAPQVIDEAKRAFLDFEGDTKIGVAAAAQRKALARQRQAVANGFDMAVNGYDPANPNDADFEELMGDYPGTPEEKEAMRMQWEATKRKKDAFYEIHEDPKGWLEDHPEPTGNPAEWDANRRRAKALLGERGREQADEVLDAIYDGSLTDEADIEALTPDLGARAREGLRATLRDRGDDELQRMMREPEFQEQVSGEVARLIAGYEPTGEAFDADYVAIRQRIDLLPSGPLKSEFEAQVRGIRDGKEREIKTVQDWTRAQIDEAHKDGGLTGTPPAEPRGQSLRAYLDDGFLQNQERLRSFGFTEDQAEDIAEAAEDQAEAVRNGYKHDGPDPEDLVRQYWSKGNAAEEDFPTGERAVFQAIRDGKSATTMIVDPAEQASFQGAMEDRQREQDRAYGRAMQELAEFQEFNPQATMQEAAEFLGKIKIDIEAGETNSSWKPRPRSQRLDEVESMPLPSGLKDYEGAFLQHGKDHGVDPRLLAAISRLETNNGKSSAFRKKKNAMGVSDAKGPIAFDNAEDSIARMARVLASSKGPYRNATTLKEIGRIYAPPGATNDINGTNSYWARGVAKYLRELGVSDPYSATLLNR